MAKAEHASPENWFSREYGNHDLLSAEGERELIEKAQSGDDEAFEQIVLWNIRLVMNIARWYDTNNQRAEKFEFSDLVQEGVLGLMRAIETFDLDRGLRLSTYATWWIKQSIGRLLESRGARVVHVPKDQINRISKTRPRLRRELGREPTEQEIRESLRNDTAVKAFDALPKISLDKPVQGSDGETPFGDFIASLRNDEDPFLKDEREDLVKRLLGCLTDEERLVIAHCFGLGRAGKLTFDKIGEIVGKSRGWDKPLVRERIRQIRNKALAKMQEAYDEITCSKTD